jgi:microcystin-dependent protein
MSMNNLKRLGEKHMRRILILALGVISMFSLVPMASAQGAGESPYLGEIIAVPFNFAPRGWATCSGQLMSIAQNTALFSLLGTQFGGNGITNFALPDLRGRSAISSGQGPGLSPYNVGDIGGEESVTLLVSQLPIHNHPVLASSSVGNMSSPAGNAWAAQGRAPIFSASSNTSMSPGSTSLTGGGQPHENRSPYLALNYIIALQGIFPSRN